MISRVRTQRRLSAQSFSLEPYAAFYEDVTTSLSRLKFLYSSLESAETFHDVSGLTATMMHRLLASIVGGLATTLLLANATFSQTAEAEGILRATIIDQETSRPVRDVSVTLTGPLKPADFESLHRQLETFDFASAAIAGVDRTLATIIANWRKSATDTAISQRIAASDRNGMVVLHGVPAGDYLVGVERTGYFETFSNPADRSVFGRIVHLIGRQTTEMTIPVVPGASIGGRLRNANNPPAEVSVFVINYLYGIPILVPQATAPAGASYKLENLPPGEYLIGATGFPHVYHPSATDAHRATSVVIQGGETLSKIDIDYGAAKAVTISGRSILPAGFNLSDTGYRVIPRDPNAWVPFSAVMRYSEKLPNSNQFEIPGVGPGTYDFYTARRPMPEAPLIYGQIPLEVGAADVKNLVVRVQPRVTARGVVTFNGNAVVRGDDSTARSRQIRSEGTLQSAGDGTFKISLDVVLATTPISISLEPDDGARRLPVYRNVGRGLQAAVSSGAFVIPEVPGGRFRARVDILELPDAYVADIRQRGVSVYDSGITITERAPEPLEVQIDTDGSRIDGVARIEGQPARPGMMVVLAPPPARRQNRALYKVTFTDSGGRFAFRGVPPGEFKLFAWNTIPVGAYKNDVFLARYESSGRTVRVPQDTTVTVPVNIIGNELR